MVAPTEASAHPSQEQPQQEATPSIQKAIEHLRTFGAEFAEYVKYLLVLQIDRAKVSVMRAAFLAALGIIGAIVLVGALVAGAGLLLIGLSGLLGGMLGNFWAGAAIVGFLAIALPAAAALIAWKLVVAKTMNNLRRKYADAKARQKERFNRHIEEVARG